MPRDRSRYDRGYDRARGYDRPWTGGYRGGFQGGSEGIPAGGGRRWGTEPARAEEGRGRGRDLWWLGYHGYAEDYRPGPYDEQYRAFHQRSHPRFSPIGGMYPAMGGEYARRGPRARLSYDRWFSDWTRWF